MESNPVVIEVKEDARGVSDLVELPPEVLEEVGGGAGNAAIDF